MKQFSKIEFAGDENISKFFGTDIYNIFCKQVLEFEPEEILLSDESTCTDFPEDKEFYIKKIQEIFNIDVSNMKPLYIWEILQRIVDFGITNSRYL